MRVLVACERSGVVRDAFIAKGHDAWSCDLLPSEGHNVHRHIQDDVLNVLGHNPNRASGPGLTHSGYGYRLPNDLIVWENHWDMLIGHPPCTYLSSSGLHWNKRRPGRERLTEDALAFVRLLMAAPIYRVCIENPVGRIGTAIRKADQYIQPYQFGHDASKRTGLWLKNLPKLRQTNFVEPRMICKACKATNEYKASFEAGCAHCGAEAGLLVPRWANQTDSGQNRLGPSPTRPDQRAETFEGIAAAMAAQWSN